MSADVTQPTMAAMRALRDDAEFRANIVERIAAQDAKNIGFPSLEDADNADMHRLAAEEFVGIILDAFAAYQVPAVSRPAEARGEAVAWAVVGRDAGLMHTTDDYAAARAYLIQLSPSWADGDSWRVVPILYPAPSGGEADAIADDVERIVLAFDRGDSRRDAVRGLAQRIRGLAAAPRPEPGEVSEAMVEAVRSAVSRLEDACEDGGWVSESWVREQCRSIRAALAAREGA